MIRRLLDISIFILLFRNFCEIKICRTLWAYFMLTTNWPIMSVQTNVEMLKVVSIDM